jgi:hypothetical protein
VKAARARAVRRKKENYLMHKKEIEECEAKILSSVFVFISEIRAKSKKKNFSMRNVRD